MKNSNTFDYSSHKTRQLQQVHIERKKPRSAALLLGRRHPPQCQTPNFRPSRRLKKKEVTFNEDMTKRRALKVQRPKQS